MVSETKHTNESEPEPIRWTETSLGMHGESRHGRWDVWEHSMYPGRYSASLCQVPGVVESLGPTKNSRAAAMALCEQWNARLCAPKAQEVAA